MPKSLSEILFNVFLARHTSKMYNNIIRFAAVFVGNTWGIAKSMGEGMVDSFHTLLGRRHQILGRTSWAQAGYTSCLVYALTQFVAQALLTTFHLTMGFCQVFNPQLGSIVQGSFPYIVDMLSLSGSTCIMITR